MFIYIIQLSNFLDMVVQNKIYVIIDVLIDAHLVFEKFIIS
jgi:hypothetical protein